MPADDMAEGEHIEDKQGGAKHRALRDTTGDIACQGFRLSHGNMLRSPSEVG